MAAPLITREEFENRLGYTLTGNLATQVDALLEDASAVVREIGKPELDAVEPPNTHPLIRAVMVSIVRRAFVNPTAFNANAIDGHSWQASGQTGVFANHKETQMIRRAVGKLGVGSVDMESGLPGSTFSYEDALAELLGV